MPVLTKINTNVIADDAITGAKFAGDTYLENTATQNLTGTYAESRMYTSDAYTLTGDTTVNANLVLSSVKGDDSDITLTADSTTRTLTGTGVLSGGSFHGKQTLTGMAGELGSGATLGSAVTGTVGSGVIGGSGLTALGTVATGNLSNTAIVYPSGHVVQTVTDTYDPGATVQATTTGAILLGANLEVSITPTSTSNKLLINCFIPDGYTNGNASTGLHTGFRYHVNFVNSDGTILGDKEFISDHHGYANTTNLTLMALFYCTVANAPVTSPIKIRPWFKTTTNNYAIFANNSDSRYGVGCLTVQEIKA